MNQQFPGYTITHIHFHGQHHTHSHNITHTHTHIHTPSTTTTSKQNLIYKFLGILYAVERVVMGGVNVRIKIN